MTEQEIDALPAGRELDALVAERVFQESKPNGRPICTGSISGIMNMFEPWGGTAWTTEFQRETGDWVFVPRPYSTDITAAWEVVEELHRAYHDIKIANDCEEHTENIWFIEVTNVRAAAPTAPLAICRAALKEVALNQEPG